MIKKCNACGIEKPFSEFRKCAGVKDGLSGKCKECARLYEATRTHKAKPEKVQKPVLSAEEIKRKKARKLVDYYVNHVNKVDSDHWALGF